jgi:hypothetical protein
VPLFPGDSELQQLLHIFKLLGTPDEGAWEGVSKLRDWHEFPNWRKQARLLTHSILFASDSPCAMQGRLRGMPSCWRAC